MEFNRVVAGKTIVSIAFIAASDSFANCCRELYTRTYRMLGMTTWQIRLRLVRNVVRAVRPLLARLVLLCLTGAIFAELMLGIEGVGALFVDALRTSDLNVMRILVLFSGLIVIAISQWERAAS